MRDQVVIIISRQICLVMGSGMVSARGATDRLRNDVHFVENDVLCFAVPDCHVQKNVYLGIFGVGDPLGVTRREKLGIETGNLKYFDL